MLQERRILTHKLEKKYSDAFLSKIITFLILIENEELYQQKE
jgi:hypothetical protein